MKIIVGLSDYRLSSRPVIFVLGTFDGVHIGHQQLLHEARLRAMSAGADLVVATVLNQRDLLLDISERTKIFEKLGVDILLELPLTEEVKNLSAQQFVDKLTKMFSIDTWIGGVDLRFGKDREGDANFLKRVAAQYNFKVQCIDRISLNGEDVSSSRIRQLIQSGQEERARALLGH